MDASLGLRIKRDTGEMTILVEQIVQAVTEEKYEKLMVLLKRVLRIEPSVAVLRATYIGYLLKDKTLWS